MTELTFDIRPFDDFSLREMYDVLHLRDVVFVVGQKVTAVPEVDGADPLCHHVRCFLDGSVIGTVRIFVDAEPMIVGRVAIHPEHQGKGYGRAMMTFVNEWLGDRAAEMHAQAHLETWYASLGWERFGDTFDEAEIVHVMMRWPSSHSE